MHLTRNWSR